MEARIVDFKNETGYQDEVQQSAYDLQEQKIIDRARDILMRQRNLTENQAHEMLSTMARKKNMKLVDASKQLIETAKMLII
jgi:two-component system, response regulator / RNA-binding antiterminator